MICFSSDLSLPSLISVRKFPNYLNLELRFKSTMLAAYLQQEPYCFNLLTTTLIHDIPIQVRDNVK